MRIGLNARLLASADQRGVNRYAAELARALAHAGAEVILFSDAPVHPTHGLYGLERVRVIASYERPRWKWQHGWLPHALAAEKVEVFHAPANWGVPWHSLCPVVATIHHLADRELPAGFARWSLRARLRHRIEQRIVVRRSPRLITVSEYTARSIGRFLGVPSERIAVTAPGAASAFEQPPTVSQARAIADRRGLIGPYFIHVGGFESRKNLELIVHALVALDPRDRMPVALVGARGPDAEAVAGLARAAGVERLLPQLGVIADAELAGLYACAAAVIVPSRLEGFALSVVEAMHVGTPAIVSSAGALPEIAGDAGIVVGPDDPAALAAAMRSLASDTATRDVLAAKARARASRFTWRAAAEQTMAVYEAIVKEAGTKPG